MAFPVPSHLPRAGVPQDVSSRILSKIGSASSKELTAELASSWVAELDDTISQTHAKIHERVQSDLPSFDRQLTSAKSIHERLYYLTRSVDQLDESVTSPNSGLVPTLLRALEAHSALCQRALDSEIIYEALDELLRCRQAFDTLDDLVNEGKLPEAVEACLAMERLLAEASVTLASSDAMAQLKGKFRAAKDRTEEQLSDACTRGIVVSPREITIRSSVQVRHSQTVLSLTSIFSAFAQLSPPSLSQWLATIRRDLTTHYITYIATQPSSLSVSPSNNFTTNTESQTLSVFPSPPNTENRAAHLQNLSQLFDFLSQHLFPLLSQISPQTPETTSFVRSFAKPLSQALLHSFLIPLLPSSLEALPQFLNLVEMAVNVEEKYVAKMLGTDERDRDVKKWAEGVSGHWERKRRTEVLEVARAIVLAEEDGSRVSVELEVEVEVPVGLGKGEDVATGIGMQAQALAEMGGDADDDAWGLEEEQIQAETEEVNCEGEEADEWGFDDEPVKPEETPVASPLLSSKDADRAYDDDAEDAWGWNDNEEERSAEFNEATVAHADVKPNGNGLHNGDGAHDPPSAETEPEPDPWDDDPWGESTSPQSSPTAPIPAPPLRSEHGHDPAPVPAAAPKRATRLEKLANKAKGKHQQSASQSSRSSMSPPHTPSSVGSPALVGPPPPTPVKSARKVETNRPQKISVPVKPPSGRLGEVQPVQVVVPQKEKETYMISARTRSLATIVQSTVKEGQLFTVSGIFGGEAISRLLSPSDRQKRGTVLSQSASAMLDLWRALYPVRFSRELNEGRVRGMVFANDCTYLGSWAKKLAMEDAKGESSEKEKLMDVAERLTVLGDSWYEDMVEKQKQTVADSLGAADGFVDTGDQERFDECESAVTGVMGLIRNVARTWKTVLNKTKYFKATGSLVDAALSHMLADISALRDITEVESHRLSELCRILNALEGLFMAESEEASLVVAYVPSWLKYSYLSELLEASLVDVTYLFEEGALVDFEIDELVRLVKALFAETPQRTSLISKLMAGHPQSAS